MVPKTFVGGGRMRYALPEGGTEPIGNRIITLPADQSRVTKRDPKSGFIAYVPVGSIKKGEALVKTGQAANRSHAASATARRAGMAMSAPRRPSPGLYCAPALHVQRRAPEQRRCVADERPVASLTDDESSISLGVSGVAASRLGPHRATDK